MLMNPPSISHEQLDALKALLAKSCREDETSEKILRILQKYLSPILAQLKLISGDLAPEPTLTQFAPIITGESMANNAYVMNVGQSQPGVITPLLADGTTPSGGVVSLVVVTFIDPSATFAVGADGVTITFTGVAASTGAVSGSVAFTVTDSDSVVSTWTDPITVTVNAVAPPPQQLTQSAPIVVGTATP